MATKLDISQLDFDGIKDNLKTFLSQQDEFTDYDFQGAGMNVLLDVLAYNTHYLGYNANMLANEMYLDSADQRSSVVSLAKQVGYTPKSATSSKATIDVVVNNATGASLTMSRGTKFTTTVDDTSYSFVNNSNISISPIDGVYKFSNLDIYEGTYLNYKYTASSSDEDQRFIIPNDNVDTTTLTVKIQESASDSTTNTYTLSTGVTGIDSTSKVYFLQEVENGRYEVYFGDGVLGQAVADGNIVILDYITCNRDEANGASIFTLSDSVGGFNNVTITTLNVAEDGDDPETTYIILDTTFKFDSNLTTKDISTLQTNVSTAISTYNVNTLENFTGMFRYSAVTKTIDDSDVSILSNITKVKMYKFITPTLNNGIKYTLSFNNAFYNPHSGHNSSDGGIVSSTGFKISGDDTNEHFLDDDGAGNIRVYYLSGTTRIYTDSTYGTIDYTNGEIILTSANITSISNVDGAVSTRVRITTLPSSNDVIPVRNQVLSIDTANSTISGGIDEIESGSSQAGTSYTTTSSY